MPLDTPVPAPYDTYAPAACLLFQRFHDSIGAWPWQLTRNFEPTFWGQNLTHEFTTLLKVHLRDTPGVTQNDLLAYLEDICVDHPDSSYAGSLNRVAIGRVSKWLADKRRISGTQEQAINKSPVSLRPTRVEHSARGDTSTQECDEDDDVPSLSVLTRSRARRNARQRIIESSDEESDDDVVVVSSGPARKKSLIVTLKFTPLRGQKLSAAEPGQQNQSSAQDQNDDEPAWEGFSDTPSAEGSSSPDLTHLSQEGAQQTYVAYLKDRISKSDATIARTQSYIDTATKRHTELLERLRVNTDARERATTDVANARYALLRASARCDAEAELQNELRRLKAQNSPGFLPAIEEFNDIDADAARLHHEAKGTLAAKLSYLADICNEVQMAEDQTSSMSFRIDVLSEVKKNEEKKRRSLVMMCRLMDMGLHLVDALDGTLGEKTLDEWTDEQMREIGNVENEGAT
ncbi:hypothetical protein FSARC_3658 [Fusarium sarcochroum]|uniref:Uncharacterized protein n=1 Tax=Fusarium sarcochroum TaxID=1208366 RepID=A0A8H4XCD0_9HYPO|nr:hypothetical protein FSARC_3658 [Fusarium sarcochroum]